MSKFNSEKVLPRYLFLAVVLTIIGVAVIAKATITMTVKKGYWENTPTFPVMPSSRRITAMA